MRLNSRDIQKILATVKNHLQNMNHQVFLFGSRLDDRKRGGDIDLLLCVDHDDFEPAHSKKALLKFELEDVLGDQRVDLTLTTPKKMSDDEFIKSIVSSAQMLSEHS